MRDRNPAQTTKICNKCGKVGLRQYISFKFIQHYGVYCTECNYKSEASPSERYGTQEWSNAKELKETPEQRISRINESLRGK